MKPLLFTFPAFFPSVAGVNSRTSQQSAGCGKSVPSVIHLGTSKNLTIDSSSGVTPRKYRINVPTSYDPNVAVPLIFSFHGRSKDMKFQDELAQFENERYGYEGIAVFPEGVPNKKGTKQWQGDPNAPSSINDVTFTLELLDHILDRYCIDPSRIYASGKSNGGGFTGVLACDSSATERIAAFACVSGAFYLDNKTAELPPCNPTTTRDVIPIMEFHGLLDDTIEYDGGLNDRGNATTVNIPEWVNEWAERDGFDPNANQTGELCEGDQTVTTYNWSDTVVHYKYANMEHDWPSEFGNRDSNITTCADADGTRVILDWFGRWSL